MDKFGNIFVNFSQKFIKHSSFLAGKPVASAGWIEINSGVLEYIDDFSGHYQPKIYQSIQIINEILKNNINNWHFKFYDDFFYSEIIYIFDKNRLKRYSHNKTMFIIDINSLKFLITL
jgi:hypothetical protein